MHEMSLVQSMFDQVLALAQEHGAIRVNSITVRIGPFSGVVADSFAFGFEVLKKNEPCLQAAVLHLEQPEPRYLCLDCGAETALPRHDHLAGVAPAQMGDDFSMHRQCPGCASQRLSPLEGTELILQQIRME